MPFNKKEKQVALLLSISAATLIVPHRALGSGDYTWASNSPASRTWDLSTPDWALAGSLVAWTNPGASGESEADFSPSATVGKLSVPIPPATISVNAAISADVLSFSGPGFTLAPGTGSLTLVGTDPRIYCDSNATISVPLSGTGGINFISNTNATLTLAGASTYTGGTNIANGTLSLAVNNALPNADVTNSGTLTLNTFNQSLATVTNNGAISAAGGNLSISSLTNTGTVSITGGNLTISSLINNAPLSAAPTSSTSYDGAITVGDLSGTGNIVLANTLLTAGVNAGVIDAYYGNLSGNGSLFKTGSSELFLLGNNTLTGALSAPAINVDGGTLAGNTFSLTGSIDVLANATLDFAQPINGTFAGVLSGNGTVNLAGLAPSTVLTFNAPNTFTGNLQVSGNLILAVSADNQLGTVTTIKNGQKSVALATFTFNGGTLRTTGALSSPRTYIVSATGGTLDTDGFSSTFSGGFSSTGNATLAIIGGGTATFDGTVSLNALSLSNASFIFAGPSLSLAATSTSLALNNATAALSNASATGAVSILGNSTLTLDTSFSSGAVSLGTTAASNATILVSSRAAWPIGGNLNVGIDAVTNLQGLSTIPGLGSITVPNLATLSVAGTTTLSASSTVTVSGGQFSTGALTSTANASPTISLTLKSSSLVIGADNAANTTFNGDINGPGNLQKLGNNTQTLAGNNTYTGTTKIVAGTLVIASNTALPAASFITNYANLTLAAPALTASLLSGNGALTLGSNDRLTLIGTSASEQSALFLSPGALLDIGANPFIIQASPATKSAFLFQASADVAFAKLGDGGITSSTVNANPATTAIAVVDNASLPTPFTNFHGQPVDSNAILIAPTLLGDANLDGAVNLTDLQTILAHLGQSNSNWTAGNFDGTATIDLNDLNAVLNNLGATYANNAATLSLVPSTASAPEPATALLLTPLLLLARRKKFPSL